MTISFILIIKLGCQFTFTVYVLCCCLAHWHITSDILTSWMSELVEKRGEGKHFFVACVTIVMWHFASLWFLDAWILPTWRTVLIAAKERESGWSLPDSASLHGCGDGHGFVDVVGENGSNQTIICVVGSFYHFLDSFEFHDLLDWSKNL